ncbi:MAG: galactosyldiacylglycerol synthase [Candidatus Riflebacteria bacterium]|nr:galactosyldiacylglycerol synthase [Candidatus Riflebacteria bacterium]
MKSTKIAIFSVSAGAGHVRAAQAIEKAAKLLGTDITAVHLDLMEIVPDLFKKLYADSYLKIVEHHPDLWGYLYRKADREKPDSLINKIRKAFQRLNTSQLDETIASLAPDVVICTHFLPAELLSRMIEKGEFDKKVWVQVTDYDVHAMWIHPNMSGYFTGNAEVAFRLIDRGIPAERVHVTGIPIDPVFSEKLSRADCASESGISPDKFTILMMAGGAGLGALEELVERMVSIPGDFQVIALAGKNLEMLEKLTALKSKYPEKLYPVGFTKTIEKLMAASDLAITKPGGLTTSECLATGLPMILVSPIPGQEERNADYLLEGGAALKACDAPALEYRLRFLLNNRQKLAEMREKAISIAHPKAAESVLKNVLG